MRSIPKLKNVPIVLMTAFALSSDEIQRIKDDYGVDHVINKPLPDFDKLRTILHDIIAQKSKA
jgi:CheY-like chemotaxis protein